MAQKNKKQSPSKLTPVERECKVRLEEANCHVKNNNLEKALDSYKKALELNPEEKNALVARSKCYILLGQPDKALQDAEKALEIDKKFVKALYQKAEALYYLGHFEHSLMYYHRGLKIRPEHEGFQLGVKKAQKAIKNAIGSGMHTSKKRLSSTKPRGKDSSKTSSKISTPSSKPSSSTKDAANEGQQQTLKETKSKCSSSKSSRKVSLTLKVNYKPDTASRVLRELRVDKDYLDKLLKNPNIRNAENGNSAIVGYIKDAVDFLNSRQEFWRQQSPHYAMTNTLK